MRIIDGILHGVCLVWEYNIALLERERERERERESYLIDLAVRGKRKLSCDTEVDKEGCLCGVLIESSRG